MAYQVATFYQFVPVGELEQKQSRWQGWCDDRQIRGTILLAPEGLNATIAGLPEDLAETLTYLAQELGSEQITPRMTESPTLPFQRMKVKIKPEIVTFGRPDLTPFDHPVGEYVAPDQWNALIQDPDVIVIDTRNEYEVAIGTFEGAINPHTDHFRQFLDFVTHHLDPIHQPKLALFCTGGIRCEKATAYLKDQGFDQVYHLQGGILNYLATIPPEESLWQGECFVFDERVAVKPGLKPGSYALCQACGYPLSEAERRSPLYIPNRQCPHCYHLRGQEILDPLGL